MNFIQFSNLFIDVYVLKKILRKVLECHLEILTAKECFVSWENIVLLAEPHT